MGISNSKLVFLDETGFDLYTSINYGYSPKNITGYTMVKANKDTNQSLMCTSDSNGVIAYEVIKGAYDGKNFKQFIQEKLLPYFLNHRDSILIIYNC